MNWRIKTTSLSNGHHGLVIRTARDNLSLRLNLRTMVISAIIVILCFTMLVVSLAMGDYPISASVIAGTFLGHGTEIERMIVMEWRLPRILFALLLGGALGLSGAIFQSVTRNPLGSPDVIGFSTGSYTGALTVMLLLSGGSFATAVGALFGGLITAITIYLLAYRFGAQGFRLIVIGIGISAMLAAFNAWLLRTAELQMAMSAAIWGAGSLNDLGNEQLLPVFIVVCVTIPTALFLERPMRQLELGDDIAYSTGIRADQVRMYAMAIGVVLTATVTATAGPIAFIALVAPQITRRLIRSGNIALLPSALTGSLLLLAADRVAQHGFSAQLPVGVMTVSIGGLYFLWLIIREGFK